MTRASLLRLLLALALLAAPAREATARKWQQRPEFDLIIGRFPRPVPEQQSMRAEPPPRGAIEARAALAAGGALAAGTSYEALAWLVRHGHEAEPALYVAIAEQHAADGDEELAWWAMMRAIELGAPDAEGLRARCAEIEAGWRATGRKDPPTAEQYRFVRAAADRWLAAYWKALREAIAAGEDPDDPRVIDRVAREASFEVPQVVLGADSTMRRWGIPALIAAIGLAFGGLYLAAVIRGRRRARNRVGAQPG